MGYNIDLTYLTEITGGESSIMAEMIGLFLEETPKQIQLLKEHHENQDWALLGAEAHKLKPTFLYVGLSGLNELTVKVEKSAKNKVELDKLKALIEEIDTGFKSIQSSLKEKLSELQS